MLNQVNQRVHASEDPGFANEVRGLRNEMLRNALLKPVLTLTWLIALAALVVHPGQPSWRSLVSTLSLFMISLLHYGICTRPFLKW